MSGTEGLAAVHSFEDQTEDDDDDELDETLGERLWGLTEMFPDAVCGTATASVSLAKRAYGWSRTGLWVAATSFMILALPVLFEDAGLQAAELQLQQQRNILFGPMPPALGRV